MRLVAGSRRALWVAALFPALFFPAPGQDRIGELQAQFNRESDPVRKARVLPKLGDAQFDEVRRATRSGDFVLALKIIQEYRDEVKAAEAALQASGLDAERKPAGFKQLQIHVRKSLREIEETALVAPDEQRPAFEAIKQELAGIERNLLGMLFPRQPEKASAPDRKR